MEALKSFAASPDGQAALAKATRALSLAGAGALGLAALRTVNSMLSNYAVGNPVLPWSGPPAEWQDISRETVLITGAASGMGREMVLAFAKLGAKVVAVDINSPLDPGSFPGEKEHVFFYRLDVTDAAAIDALVAELRAKQQSPTVLVNNAGIFSGRALLDTPAAHIQRTLAVNAAAPLVLTRAFLPDMLAARHGHVLAMASLASFITVAGNVDYSCSKLALLAFSEGLSQELRWRYGAPGIRVSTVHPFWVETPLIQPDRDRRKNFANEPIMPAAFVADAVVAHIRSGRSGQLVLPRWAAVAAYLRALPVWLQEMVRNDKGRTLEISD